MRLVAATLVLAAVLTRGAVFAQFDGVCGDANGDGEVTVTDGVETLRAAAQLSTVCKLTRCDVDGDGEITVTDGVNILRAAAELPNICSPTAGITQFVTQTRGGLTQGRMLANVTQGRLEIGLAPVPDAGALHTIVSVEAEGQAAALPNLTRDLRVPYDVGAQTSAAAGDLALIVAVRRQDGSDVDGFFEVPLAATAADNAIASLTFPPNLGNENFTLRVATRFQGAVGAFLEIGISPIPLPNATLSFVDAVNIPGPFGAFFFQGKPRAAVSADGAHLYVASDGVLNVFRRDVTSGNLMFLQAVAGAPDCEDRSCPDSSVATSPDGAYVYFGSGSSTGDPPGPLAVFRRDPATGMLTFVEAQRVEPSSIAISPDGAHVYATSFRFSSLSVFRRDAATGTLTTIETKVNGTDPVAGLENPSEVRVSPDGAHVYVVGASKAIFQRNPTTGALTFLRGEGTVGPTSFVISSDGLYVYTTTQDFVSLGPGSLDVFRRDPTTGSLMPIETKVNGVDGVDGLFFPETLTISADGTHVYVISFGTFSENEGAVSVFRRDLTTGRLTFVEAQFNGVGNVRGLSQPLAIATSPDGAYLYTTEAQGDQSVDVFRIVDEGRGR